MRSSPPTRKQSVTNVVIFTKELLYDQEKRTKFKKYPPCCISRSKYSRRQQKQKLSTTKRTISRSCFIVFVPFFLGVQNVLLLLPLCYGSKNLTEKATNANVFLKDHPQQQHQQQLQPPLPERINGDVVVMNRLDTSRIAPFDKDIREDCRSLLVHCTSDIFAHVYLQCPASCTQLLQEEGMRGTATHNPDKLYDVGTLRTYQGQRINTDRFEGNVLVVAIVPLLPGMAVYYYEMMEHLHTVFTPHVEFVIIPMDLEHGIHIQQRRVGGKVVILEEESVTTALENHPWIQHLSSIRPRSGLGTREGSTEDNNDVVLQRPIQTDRVTFYIVSADGYYVESLISPTMERLQKKIILYQKTIDYEL
jgi:hypothetical protein